MPDADQYKYGKNRVEADAKRLQTKEDELLRRKEALRNRLAQLRKERRDLRAAIEANAGMQGTRRARAETPLPAPRPRPPGLTWSACVIPSGASGSESSARERRARARWPNRSTQEAGPGPRPAGGCGSCPGRRC